MTLKNSIIALFCLLSLALIAAGIWLAGGPATARAEMRDAERMEDLHELRELTFCLAETAGGVLPDAIDMSAICQREIALTDPFTGQAYRYSRISERAYKWCADFEMPDRISAYGAQNLDQDTGCVQFTYRP